MITFPVEYRVFFVHDRIKIIHDSKKEPPRKLRMCDIQYTPRNMHTIFALLCFVVVIHWLIFPYPSGLLHWHCGNLTIAPVPAKQPWWIWINTSCEFIMNDCITTTKQNTTKPCAYFLGYTVDGTTRGEETPHIASSRAICAVYMVNVLMKTGRFFNGFICYIHRL